MLELPAGYHWYETMIVLSSTMTDEDRCGRRPHAAIRTVMCWTTPGAGSVHPHQQDRMQCGMRALCVHARMPRTTHPCHIAFYAAAAGGAPGLRRLMQGRRRCSRHPCCARADPLAPSSRPCCLPRDRELAKFEAFLNKEECLSINALIKPRVRMAYPIKR